MWLPKLAWWVYLIIVLSLFIGCLSLNYMVKKINETRIEERFLRLANKASTSQSTQVQYPLIVMETGRADEVDTSKGISLVFDKEENLLNEKKRAIEEDIMQEVENILAKKEDNIAVVKQTENTDSEVTKQNDVISEQMSDSESRIDVIIKPTFLGNIYKSANDSVCSSKLNRDNDRDSILSDLLEDIMLKVKSASSVKKCNVSENYKE